MAFFDGVNKLVILDAPTASVLNVLVQRDLYSEAKVWAKGEIDFATDTDVNGSTERITFVDHGLHDGQRVVYSSQGGSDAIGLTDGTAYFVRYIDRDTLEVYDTEANANAGPSTTGRQDLTAGTGETHRLQADNTKWPFPFRTVGGDPLGGGVTAGAYFFLQNQDGWRIISTDQDQTINYSGNLVAEDPTLPIVTARAGRTVLHLGLQPVTQGTDDILSLVSEVYGHVQREVFVNTELASDGDGSQQSPFNNFTSAADYAEANGLLSIVLLADANLDRNMRNFTFRGIGHPKLDFSDFDGDKSDFYNLRLAGTIALVGGDAANIRVTACTLENNLKNIGGNLITCGFNGDLTFGNNASVKMVDCFSSIGGSGRPTTSIGTASNWSIRSYRGGLTIKDQADALTEGTVSMSEGKLTLAATCTAGTISVRGQSQFTDLSAGSTIDETGHVDTEDLRLMKALIANRVELVDIGGGQVRIDAYDDDSTTVIRQLVLNSGETSRTVL